MDQLLQNYKLLSWLILLYFLVKRWNAIIWCKRLHFVEKCKLDPTFAWQFHAQLWECIVWGNNAGMLLFEFPFICNLPPTRNITWSSKRDERLDFRLDGVFILEISSKKLFLCVTWIPECQCQRGVNAPVRFGFPLALQINLFLSRQSHVTLCWGHYNFSTPAIPFPLHFQDRSVLQLPLPRHIFTYKFSTHRWFNFRFTELYFSLYEPGWTCPPHEILL